jgi:hypothetical protein
MNPRTKTGAGRVSNRSASRASRYRGAIRVTREISSSDVPLWSLSSRRYDPIDPVVDTLEV